MKKSAFQDRNLESVLRESLKQRRRERGETQLRLVTGPGGQTPGTEEAGGGAGTTDEEDPQA